MGCEAFCLDARTGGESEGLDALARIDTIRLDALMGGGFVGPDLLMGLAEFRVSIVAKGIDVG